MSLVKNLPTHWELRRKTGQGLINEKPPNPVGTKKENRRLMTEAQKAKEVDSGMRLESRRVDVLMKVGWKSHAVTCSHVQSNIVRLRMSSV